MEERRKLDFGSAPISTRTKGGKMYIDGMIPYGSRSEDMGFREEIRRGAFRSALEGANVYAFWAHDEARVLASTSARTLRLTDSAGGLAFAIQLRDSAAGEDYFQAVQRGDVVGVSFGFITKRDSWNADRSVRILEDVDLLEVSPGVAFPAYQAAASSADTRMKSAFPEALRRAKLDEVCRKYSLGAFAPRVPKTPEEFAAWKTEVLAGLS